MIRRLCLRKPQGQKEKPGRMTRLNKFASRA
jgi:hypothetical protein